MSRPTRVPLEETEQMCLMEWAALMERAHPELRWLHAIPNGGLRSKTEAARLKRQGVKAGVADLCLPCARNGCHGLYIEMKRQKGGRLSDEQDEFGQFVTEQGYRWLRCNGWQAAAQAIADYLGFKL